MALTPAQSDQLKGLFLEQYHYRRRLEEISGQIYSFMVSTNTEAAELQLMAFGKPEEKKPELKLVPSNNESEKE